MLQSYPQEKSWWPKTSHLLNCQLSPFTQQRQFCSMFLETLFLNRKIFLEINSRDGNENLLLILPQDSLMLKSHFSDFLRQHRGQSYCIKLCKIMCSTMKLHFGDDGSFWEWFRRKLFHEQSIRHLNISIRPRSITKKILRSYFILEVCTNGRKAWTQ